MRIDVRGNSRGDLDRSLKLFNKMVKKSELMKELKRREAYVTPSRKRTLKREESLRRRIRDAKKAERNK